MRRIVLSIALMALCLTPPIASAKLPFFGLEVDPLHARVVEPITLTMTCYDDMDHMRPSSSCMGAGGTMAWVHPLDHQGALDQGDWIAVEGHTTSSVPTRGRITLDEPGAYDVFPLWRTWGAEARDGFPGAIRIEVTQSGRITPVALAAFGVAGMSLALVAGGAERPIRNVAP